MSSDAEDGAAVRLEVAEFVVDLSIKMQVEGKGSAHAEQLADDSSPCSAAHAHFRQAAPAVDQERVEDDVHHGTGDLGDGGVQRTAGGLQHLFVHREQYDAEGDTAADVQIGDGHVQHFGADAAAGALGVHIGAHAQQAEQHEHDGNEDAQHLGVAGGAVGAFLVTETQQLCQQGIGAHAGADGHGHHEQLYREGKAQGSQSVLAAGGHAGQIGAVHHVIGGLQHHGQHDGQTDTEHQRRNGLHRHFILGTVLHKIWFPPFGFCAKKENEWQQLDLRSYCHSL